MTWVDGSRRRAFAQTTGPHADRVLKACELDSLLPQEIVERSIAIGNERILPYENALAAIKIATEHLIAVLGFEAGEIKEDGFQVVDYSGYGTDILSTGNWRAYVADMNARAMDWIETHHYGRNHGYILTSASEKELAEAHRKVDR